MGIKRGPYPAKIRGGHTVYGFLPPHRAGLQQAKPSPPPAASQGGLHCAIASGAVGVPGKGAAAERGGGHTSRSCPGGATPPSSTSGKRKTKCIEGSDNRMSDAKDCQLGKLTVKTHEATQE